jgi:hypothetical protein
MTNAGKSATLRPRAPRLQPGPGAGASCRSPASPVQPSVASKISPSSLVESSTAIPQRCESRTPMDSTSQPFVTYSFTRLPGRSGAGNCRCHRDMCQLMPVRRIRCVRDHRAVGEQQHRVETCAGLVCQVGPGASDGCSVRRVVQRAARARPHMRASLLRDPARAPNSSRSLVVKAIMVVAFIPLRTMTRTSAMVVTRSTHP